MTPYRESIASTYIELTNLAPAYINQQVTSHQLSRQPIYAIEANCQLAQTYLCGKPSGILSFGIEGGFDAGGIDIEHPQMKLLLPSCRGLTNL